jgi:hypothetical protein
MPRYPIESSVWGDIHGLRCVQGSHWVPDSQASCGEYLFVMLRSTLEPLGLSGSIIMDIIQNSELDPLRICLNLIELTTILSLRPFQVASSIARNIHTVLLSDYRKRHIDKRLYGGRAFVAVVMVMDRGSLRLEHPRFCAQSAFFSVKYLLCRFLTSKA